MIPVKRRLIKLIFLENDANNTHYNVKIWKVEGFVNQKPILLGRGFSHKLQATWPFQWTADESHVARMVSGGSEIQFYRTNDLEAHGDLKSMPNPAFRLLTDNIGTFAISPGPYPKVAVFIKENKGAPAAVKVFLLPSTTVPVAQKMFYKADRCQLDWSSNGKSLLALAQTEVDSRGDSYYGESNLYYISGDGSFDCRVELDREGPIHDYAWSPLSNEFIVLYGFMPSKAMLFGAKCNPTFEFPVGSKNHIRWSPSGALLCFGGFGNLPGHIEIWSRTDALRRVGHFQAPSSSVCEWAPNGAVVVTATVTPRLRVDNGFKVWNWNGTMVANHPYQELNWVQWKWEDSKTFAPVDVSTVPCTASGLLKDETTSQRQVYVPPGLRNKKAEVTALSNASKLPETKVAPKINAPSSLSKEERAVKRLQKKLEEISSLKERQAKGEALELNQVEKINKELEIRKELENAKALLNRALPVLLTK